MVVKQATEAEARVHVTRPALDSFQSQAILSNFMDSRFPKMGEHSWLAEILSASPAVLALRGTVASPQLLNRILIPAGSWNGEACHDITASRIRYLQPCIS